MENTTANEKELLEIIRTSENPEKAVEIAVEILKLVLADGKERKIFQLVTGRYSSIADFANAVNMSEEAATNIIIGKTKPTSDEVIIIAKALNKEPEEIAQIFSDQQTQTAKSK